MALTNATLSTGATISVTGGTTMTFAQSGTSIADGVELIDVNAADYRTRTKVACRSRMPVYTSTTSSWSKGKRIVQLTSPVILADGSTVAFPLIRLEMEDHVEQTAAQRLEMRKLMAQILIDADFDTFFVTGSRA